MSERWHQQVFELRNTLLLGQEELSTLKEQLSRAQAQQAAATVAREAEAAMRVEAEQQACIASAALDGEVHTASVLAAAARGCTGIKG